MLNFCTSLKLLTSVLSCGKFLACMRCRIGAQSENDIDFSRKLFPEFVIDFNYKELFPVGSCF